MSTDTTHIGRRMAKGAAWTVSMRLAIRSLGLVSTVILARLLVPEDFGLVALAMMLMGLLEVMSEFSFSLALIRNQDAGRPQYDTAWTLSVIRGAVVAALLAVLAAPAAAMFAEPRVEAIVYCLALVSVVMGFQNVGVVDFQKEMTFHKDFAFTTIEKLGAFTVTIALAILWRDYWALIVGTVTGKLLRVVLSYLMHHYRPRFSLAAFREIMGFTKWLLANNIFGYFFLRADTFVVGKILGAQSLGIYTIAHEISNLVTTELVMPIRRAIYPGYAKLAGDKEALAAGFLGTLSIIAMITLPVAVGVGLVADPLVRLMLGDKWIQAIPLIQVLVFYGAVNVVSSVSGSIYLALDRPYYLTLLFATGFAFMVPLLYWGTVQAGTFGAAVAVTAAAAITTTIDVAVVTHLVGISPTKLVATIWRTFVALAVMGAAVLATRGLVPAGVDWPALVACLAITSTIGAVAYVGAHLTLWTLAGRPAGAEKHVLDLLVRLRRRPEPC